MLNIQKDESIHSLIYRTHVVNGVSDFSNIITKNGDWASFPKILENTLNLYQPIDDSKFLKLLRDISLAPITKSVFENPVTYRSLLLEFFGQSDVCKKVSKSSTPIKYCLHCIKNRIQKLGYGIVDVNWTISSFCSTHKTALYIVKASNRRNAIEALACIFKGGNSRFCEKPNFKSGYVEDSRECRHLKKCDFIAPCLAEELKKFISENFNEFSLNLLGQRHRSIRNLTTNHMMAKIYESAKNSNYKRFIDFWNNFAELKHIYAGVVNRKTITEEIYKSTKVDCQTCKHFSCISNLVITPTSSDTRKTQRN